MKLHIENNYIPNVQYLEECDALFSMKLYEYNFNPIQNDPSEKIHLYAQELSKRLWATYDYAFINLLWKGKVSPVNKKRNIPSDISKDFINDAFQYNVELGSILCKFEVINIHTVKALEKCLEVTQRVHFYNPNILIGNLNTSDINGLLPKIYHLGNNGPRLNFTYLKSALDEHYFDKIYFMDGDIESGSLRVIELHTKS